MLAGSDIAGSLDDLRSLVQKLEISEVVSINGPVWGEQKEKLLDRTDYFLGIFRYAGMARACGEAVARGIPLLASREGNWGDWVERCSIGYAVALDPDHVYECINKAVNIDRQAYFEFSRNAYKWATDNSWEKVAEQFCEQYENMMNWTANSQIRTLAIRQNQPHSGTSRSRRWEPSTESGADNALFRSAALDGYAPVLTTARKSHDVVKKLVSFCGSRN